MEAEAVRADRHRLPGERHQVHFDPPQRREHHQQGGAT